MRGSWPEGRVCSRDAQSTTPSQRPHPCTPVVARRTPWTPNIERFRANGREGGIAKSGVCSRSAPAQPAMHGAFGGRGGGVREQPTVLKPHLQTPSKPHPTAPQRVRLQNRPPIAGPFPRHRRPDTPTTRSSTLSSNKPPLSSSSQPASASPFPTPHPHLHRASDLPPAPSARPSPHDPRPHALRDPQAETLPPPPSPPSSRPLSPVHATRPDRPHTPSAVRPPPLGPDGLPLPALRPPVRKNPQDPPQDARLQGVQAADLGDGRHLARSHQASAAVLVRPRHLPRRRPPTALPHNQTGRRRPRHLCQRDVAAHSQGVSPRPRHPASRDAGHQLARAVSNPGPSSSPARRPSQCAADDPVVVVVFG